MSMIDQCPSTKGEIEIPGELTRPAGRVYWRSLDEYAQTPEFVEFVQREFPAGASELALAGDSGAETRRAFLKLMAAGLALAGAATIPGCRRPDQKILAYSASEPEHTIPGRPTFFATSLPLPGGGAEGLLIETHSNRPTKVEGNPMHPVNRGRSSAWSQASILGLYDPDRLTAPSRASAGVGVGGGGGVGAEATGEESSWAEFRAWQAEHFKGHEADGGRGLAFIVDASSGPVMQDMRRRVASRFRRADWVWWDPVDARRTELEGTRAALGTPCRVHVDYSQARCVLSLDADFMSDGAESLRSAREFAATRRVEHAGDGMSRLYVAESRPTGTGSLADHRMSLAPSRIGLLAVAVAKALSGKIGSAAARRSLEGPVAVALADATVPTEGAFAHAAAIAEDLAAHAGEAPGSALVVAGPGQSAEVHALVAAMNEALGAAGVSVTYSAEDGPWATSPREGLAALVGRMAAGEIRTLVVVNANPAYDAPGALGFGAAWAKVAERVTLSVERTETAMASSWALNGAHALESWGDTETLDGTVAPVQPMIAPLYAPAMSGAELLAMLAGDPEPDGYAILRGVWSRRMSLSPDDAAFEKALRRALQDGVLAGSGRRELVRARSRAGDVARAVGTLAGGSLAGGGEQGPALEVVVTPGRVGDGRAANCGWLQELPQMGTSVVWDNPAAVSPRTAEALGLLPVGIRRAEGDLAGAYTAQQVPRARVAVLTVGGREVEIPVWILPGMADGVVHVQVGYGRPEAGSVGGGVGVDVYRLLGAGESGASSLRGASLRATGRTATIASTQNHWSMESRTSIVRALDRRWFDAHAEAHGSGEHGSGEHGSAGHDSGDHASGDHGSGHGVGGLTLAEQLGELSHTPPNISLYSNPQNGGRGDAWARVGPQGAMAAGAQPDFAVGPQWGMTIDLATCTGCAVCTVACQSENNIPIVGKQEVAKGREMAWIRVDRYFTGDLNSPAEMVHQPVACVHCENAPCETVCPVNATVHGPEGTNNMAYNRCIGTRYCANNCPYKARRFNFFDYAVTKYNGRFSADFLNEAVELPDQRSFNKNLIPPRLREKVDEISKMRSNPDVTVRSRGVMEKCTYCIQRVNEARQEVKVKDIWRQGQSVVKGEGYVAPIPDGFFQTACQQACPTGSIVFGDILDPKSRVSQSRSSTRGYALLGYLNTRPRTSHLMRVRNPNPAIGVIDATDPLDHGSGHGSGHGGDAGHGGDEGHGAHSWVDPVRRSAEPGYVASLRVMS